MIADGLTKALQKQRFDTFIQVIRIVDIKERLMAEKRIKALRD